MPKMFLVGGFNPFEKPPPRQIFVRCTERNGCPPNTEAMSPPAVRARFNGGSELAWETAAWNNEIRDAMETYSKRHKKRDQDLPNVGKKRLKFNQKTGQNLEDHGRSR